MMEQMQKMMEQMPFGKMPFGEMPFGEMPFGEMPFGEMPFGKQMMDFYKTMYSNAVNAMDMINEQNDKMTEMFLENATFLPEQAKQPIKDFVKAAKKGQEDFKKAVDDNFKTVTALFDTTEKVKPAAEKKK